MSLSRRDFIKPSLQEPLQQHLPPVVAMIAMRLPRDHSNTVYSAATRPKLK